MLNIQRSRLKCLYGLLCRTYQECLPSLIHGQKVSCSQSHCSQQESFKGVQEHLIKIRIIPRQNNLFHLLLKQIIFNFEQMKLGSQQKLFYNKIEFLASIQAAEKFDTRTLNNQNIYQVCQYVEPYIINKDKYDLKKRIQQYRSSKSGDSCLHIAARAGNYKLVTFLIQNKIIDPNTLNHRKQNALMSVLSDNAEKSSQKIAYFLSEYTDLTAKNTGSKRAFQVYQSKMDPSRARLLEYLRNKVTGN